MTTPLTRRTLVSSILSFLRSSLTDGSIKSEDVEGLEVAIQCIGEAFGVEESDGSGDAKDLKNAWEAWSKTKEKMKAGKDKATASTSSPAQKPAPTPAAKSEAEAHKAAGNSLMSSKDYNGAIAEYGQAIEKDWTNPVYFSNRAAAYSQLSKHAEAIQDANKALELDSKFSKAYSRLGHALFSSGKYSQAVDAYQKGLDLDPTNTIMKNSLATAKSKAATEKDASVDDDDEVEDIPRSTDADGVGAGGMPDLSSLLGGMGRGGGAGGMGGLMDMMNNPAIMNMAQQLMNSPQGAELFNNPTIRNMANQMQNGGGMPDFSQLMNDPSLRNMAEQFGRGRGGV